MLRRNQVLDKISSLEEEDDVQNVFTNLKMEDN